MEVTTLAAWCYLLRGVAEGGQQWRLMAATSRLSGVSGVRGATSPFSPGSLKHSQHHGHQYAVATHIPTLQSPLYKINHYSNDQFHHYKSCHAIGLLVP